MKDEHKYDGIINLPHHVSKRHPQMSNINRAAQFAPFAALTGFGDAISEAGRFVDEKIVLGDGDMDVLNLKFGLIGEEIGADPEVTVTYFVPDKTKSGGVYLQKTCRVKRIDETERMIHFTDGVSISLDDIADVDGDMFRFL